jgi:hypothetical protein
VCVTRQTFSMVYPADVNYAELKAHDDTPPAPEPLEVVQRFLNLHDHVPGSSDDQPPPPDTVRDYLLDRGLLSAGDAYTDEDHARAMRMFDALHARILDDDAEPHRTKGIDDLADRAGFHVRFGNPPSLEPVATGVDGALGKLLSIVFLAELDGTWAHLKECASDTCHSVFYDRSRNRSARWCSMRSCGNQHKVRAWRERQRTDAVDA